MIGKRADADFVHARLAPPPVPGEQHLGVVPMAIIARLRKKTMNLKTTITDTALGQRVVPAIFVAAHQIRRHADDLVVAPTVVGARRFHHTTDLRRARRNRVDRKVVRVDV